MFVIEKKNPKKKCKKNPEKWQPRSQNRPELGKPETDLLENRPSVGFRFIENRSVPVMCINTIVRAKKTSEKKM
jgi:hypothetical protein